MFESTRVNLDKIMKRYRDYIDLYTYLNDDSAEGATTFAEFYWRITYHDRYQDPEVLGRLG